MNNPQKTVSERLQELYESKIAEGYQILDRESALKLRKICMSELNLKRGNWHISGDALNIIMEKKAIKIANDMPAKSLADLKVKLIKSETMPPPPPGQASPFGTLPAPPTAPTDTAAKIPSLAEAPPVKKIVTDDMAASWERGLKMGFGKLMSLYAKIGAIEVEDVKAPKEKKTLADYTKDTDEFAHDVVSYCKANNVMLPKAFELVTLCISGFVLLGSPLLNLFFFGGKGKKPDEVKNLGKDEKDSKVLGGEKKNE